jgi:uncharacterized protein YbjT (DUF2867 family)
VKLSARGAALDSPVAFWDWHARIERHLADSGIPATVLRPSFSMANLLPSLGLARSAGVLPLPAGDARVAMIDPADVAAVAARVLLDQVTGSYELTGPVAVGFLEVAAALSAEIGREVSYVDVPPEQAVPAMVADGVPPFAAEQIGNVFTALRAGAQAAVTDDVRRLTGRGPADLLGFLASLRSVPARS